MLSSLKHSAWIYTLTQRLFDAIIHETSKFKCILSQRFDSPCMQGGPGFKSPTNLSRELWREWGEVDLPNSRREERAQHSGKSEDLSIAATLGARDDSEGDVFRIALDGKEAGE